MADEIMRNGLASALLQVASDPSQIDELHAILGTFCHQCRNTLNSLKMSLYLAKRGGGITNGAPWRELEQHYRWVEDLFDRLQSICRPVTLATVRLPLSLLMEERREAWVDRLARVERRLKFLPSPKPVIGDFDPTRLGQGLDALVAWRCSVGAVGDRVCVAWKAEGGHFHLDWTEPDVRHGEVENGFDVYPEALGLPLLARVISAHGGTIGLGFTDGWRLSIRWPLDVGPRSPGESSP